MNVVIVWLDPEVLLSLLRKIKMADYTIDRAKIGYCCQRTKAIVRLVPALGYFKKLELGQQRSCVTN